MSLASRTREAVRREPFLRDALRAGVVNYAAAARYLDVGDEDAVVAALRRLADDLAGTDPPTANARVRMHRDVGEVAPEDAVLVVGDLALAPEAGSATGVVATGDLEPWHLSPVLGCLDAASVDVDAAAVSSGTLWVVVDGRAGPDALRAVEDALDRA